MIAMPNSDTKPQPCFHCGLPIPDGVELTVEIDGEARRMCCHGCEAVANAIVAGGMTSFYRYRTVASPTAKDVLPEFLDQLRAYDNPAIQQKFVKVDQDQIREAALILEGITCAACVWLNERHLASLPGVLQVSVNYSTHRARVRWDNDRISLSQILEATTRIGYLAHPYDPGRQQEVLESERKGFLRRLGVAGLLGMQIMILAAATYAGDWWGIRDDFRSFFAWVSLVLTTPILTYSAQPFFGAALRDLKARRMGMDVPVSLGITIAFAGSVYSTLTGRGNVYYDSVAMFVFFLLTARYLELAARKRSAEAGESLVQMRPAMATKLLDEGGTQTEQVVPAADLVTGDRVLIRPGESVAADGRVEEGESTLDESLLTGESLPVPRGVGDPLVGGSTNIDSPLILRVEKTGEDTVLAAIVRLLDRAQSEKPALARLVDRAASWFVMAIVLLATVVSTYWYYHAPELWLPITVSVLVVTCPCALSLATPAAITAATGALMRLGVLTTRGHALETLASATHFVFDKTGTLTAGKVRLLETRPLGTLDKTFCLQTAAALESGSEHPIARAFREAVPDRPQRAHQIANTPGAGVAGTLCNRRWYLGRAEFVAAESGVALPTGLEPEAAGRTRVFLADRESVCAMFVLGDDVRTGANTLVSGLKDAGLEVLLLTGDSADAAARVAREVGIARYEAGLTPADKLRRVRDLQGEGGIVAMVGDGINDAPVLAGADVSIAMGEGTHLAASHSDMILLSERLERLLDGYRMARKTFFIIRQNLAWALAYNVLAVPAAAAGHVPPWLAAIGMSASSLLVVVNALRLTRFGSDVKAP